MCLRPGHIELVEEERRGLILPLLGVRITPMVNSPEQHIDSLPRQKREEAYRQVAMVCVFRVEGLSEDEVADKAKFDSVEDMYFRLKRWGLSGLVPIEEGVDLEHTIDRRPVKPNNQRQPQPSKEPGRELPPLSNATTLFRDTINSLAVYLDNLTCHRVILRDGRFVATDEIPREVGMYPLVYLSSEYSSERWAKICADHNKDPMSTTEIYVYQGTSWSKGATHYPPWFETCLITAVLMQSPGYVERLLEEVSLEPDRVSRDQIKALLYGRPGKGDGLYATARKLARLIRGAGVRRGRAVAPVPPFRQALAQATKELREKGLADETIRQELKISEEEFDSLVKLLD